MKSNICFHFQSWGQLHPILVSEAHVRLGVMVGRFLGCNWVSIPTVHKAQSISWVAFQWTRRILVLFCDICSVIFGGLHPLLELVYPCCVAKSKGVYFWDGGSNILPPYRRRVSQCGIGTFSSSGDWVGQLV